MYKQMNRATEVLRHSKNWAILFIYFIIIIISPLQSTAGHRLLQPFAISLDLRSVSGVETASLFIYPT
jgi:hypothetical protein